MTGIAAKTSAMFNNGVTSVEVVDSDNDDIGIETNGIKKLWVPSINKFRQFFKSSPNTMPSNNKRHWRKRQNKTDTEKDQYYDPDDDQDDYSDKQELHQQVDDGNGSKRHDVEEDDDDDEEDQDEDRQVRKKMLRKQNKKEVEVKKKSKCFLIDLHFSLIQYFKE